MKKILTLLVMMGIACTTTLADDYTYLTVKKTDGTEQSFASSGLKITFSDSNMAVTASSATATFPLADLEKMFFSATATGIVNISTASQAKAGVEVFSLDGRSLGTFATCDEATNQLGHGVYIIKQNGRTFKQLVK